MLRRELLDRLRNVRRLTEHKNLTNQLVNAIDALVEDVELDGVLDVQAPADIAESLNLSRPAS